MTQERVVIILTQDGIQNLSVQFVDDALGKIISKKDFERIKGKSQDQSLQGCTFSQGSSLLGDQVVASSDI